MELAAYFDRIGYGGDARPGLPALVAIVRAHLAAIAFENLDVQLGRPVSTEAPAIYAKLVERRRGGWCYEQNGLLGWALETCGFDVMRVTGGVMRAARGDDALGNHLTLIVAFDDGPWLVDVGFGGSLAEPIPLAPGAHRHAPFDLTLGRIEDGWWRFEERSGGDSFSFDFRAEPADEAVIAAKHRWQRTHPDSPFVQNLVAQRRVGDTHVCLRGRVLSVSDAGGREDVLIADADALVETLLERFSLDVPEAAALWPKICQRHAELFPQAG